MTFMADLLEILNSKVAVGLFSGLFSILGVLVGSYVRSFTDERIEQKLKPLLERLWQIESKIAEILRDVVEIRKGQETMDDHRHRIERLENRSMSSNGNHRP